MNNRLFLTFLFTGLLIGLLATLQFKTDLPIVGNFPSDEVVAKQDLLKTFLDEQTYLQSRIVSLRKEMLDLQDNIETQTEKNNFDKLESLKKDVGLTEVRGPGLEISLKDSPLASRTGGDGLDIYLVQASDIRDVINLLFAASADGVSINGQRIIATSPIISVGTTILVNNSHLAPPFTIQAVGDTDIMLQRLLNRELLASLYNKAEKQGIGFDILKKNLIVVPIYNADLKINHIKLVE
jgi:uncharacterized protein YlxW (UPF0749 family)